MKTRRPIALNLIAASVFLSGLLTIASVLFAQTHLKQARIVTADANITVFVGLTFVYLAGLLRRGKQSAWLVALPLYIFLVIRNIRHFLVDLPDEIQTIIPVILNLMVPTIVLAGLIVARRLFKVRSELRNFQAAARRAGLVLLVAFFYGLIGFQLLDKKDFHQEISLVGGGHYTIDQLGLTTNKALVPHTKRSRLFLDSLGVISLGALFYGGAAIFGPIRFRLSSLQHGSEEMKLLLARHPSSSEDFFKLWPPDKAYFYTPGFTTGLAYRVVRGTALVVGDPAGKKADFNSLLESFSEYCRVNDWEPALIHTQPVFSALYARHGFDLQKIGQEAIIELEYFSTHVMTNKYFRNITARFKSQGYTCQLLTPPLNPAVLGRLREISDDWLKVPGRAERGFMLGYFNEDYMQQCQVMVARDAAGTIQAFINQVPVFEPTEANFDLLRHTKGSLGNVNDYLMLNFITYVRSRGFKKLNMGLAPLSGLQAGDDHERTTLDSILGLVYTAGGRFYSFQGLKRFKSKYEPEWEDRFVVYRGGLSGFIRAMNALVGAMRVSKHHLR